jgi:hypothetical protein
VFDSAIVKDGLLMAMTGNFIDFELAISWNTSLWLHSMHTKTADECNNEFVIGSFSTFARTSTEYQKGIIYH